MSDYYAACACPKPGAIKKDKKVNGYKDKPNRRCYYTGQPGADRHEVYGGSKNRQISIDNEFQVDVCPMMHTALQQNATPWAIEENKRWKKFYQKKYEKELISKGLSKEDARKVWMALIGENFI